MARIEDYAIIGDCETAALVEREGSIDWLCLPRFNSDACFARLLGNESNGHWILTPSHPGSAERRYRPGTLILETDFTTDKGRVRVIDFMPVNVDGSRIVRIVEGVEGEVEMRAELVVRFDYGITVPWVSRVEDGAISLVAGAHMLLLRTAVPLRGKSMKTVGSFSVRRGQRVPLYCPIKLRICRRPLLQIPTFFCRKPNYFGASGRVAAISQERIPTR